MPTALLVYCTCPEDTTAAQIANILIDERLAACANRIPAMSSTYMWKGKVPVTSGLAGYVEWIIDSVGPAGEDSGSR